MCCNPCWMSIHGTRISHHAPSSGLSPAAAQGSKLNDGNGVRYHIVRGTLDAVGVKDRQQGRGMQHPNMDVVGYEGTHGKNCMIWVHNILGKVKKGVAKESLENKDDWIKRWSSLCVEAKVSAKELAAIPDSRKNSARQAPTSTETQMHGFPACQTWGASAPAGSLPPMVHLLQSLPLPQSTLPKVDHNSDATCYIPYTCSEGIVPASPLQVEIFWKEKENDSDWARANEMLCGTEDDYASLREETPFNAVHRSLDLAFDRSLVLQSPAMTPRSVSKENSLHYADRSSFASFRMVPQLTPMASETVYETPGANSRLTNFLFANVKRISVFVFIRSRVIERVRVG
eukprot:Gb_09208 [translate_table: standard]